MDHPPETDAFPNEGGPGADHYITYTPDPSPDDRGMNQALTAHEADAFPLCGCLRDERASNRRRPRKGDDLPRGLDELTLGLGHLRDLELVR